MVGGWFSRGSMRFRFQSKASVPGTLHAPGDVTLWQVGEPAHRVHSTRFIQVAESEGVPASRTPCRVLVDGAAEPQEHPELRHGPGDSSADQGSLQWRPLESQPPQTDGVANRDVFWEASPEGCELTIQCPPVLAAVCSRDGQSGQDGPRQDWHLRGEAADGPGVPAGITKGNEVIHPIGCLVRRSHRREPKSCLPWDSTWIDFRKWGQSTFPWLGKGWTRRLGRARCWQARWRAGFRQQVAEPSQTCPWWGRSFIEGHRGGGQLDLFDGNVILNDTYIYTYNIL